MNLTEWDVHTLITWGSAIRKLDGPSWSEEEGRLLAALKRERRLLEEINQRMRAEFVKREGSK